MEQEEVFKEPISQKRYFVNIKKNFKKENT